MAIHLLTKGRKIDQDIPFFFQTRKETLQDAKGRSI
jgi:hypothetical protein